MVVDLLEVQAAALSRLQLLFREGYLPGAEARGLVFAGEEVTPPLLLTHQPNTLCLRWSLRDAAAFWAARAAAAADPAVAVFWSAVDRIVTRRERHYLVAGDAPLPAPVDIGPCRVAPRAWRETAQLYLHANLPPGAHQALLAVLGRCVLELPGLRAAALAPNPVTDFGAGHFTWDLLYDDRAVADAARNGRFWRDQVLPEIARCCRACSALGLETIGAGAREPALAGGIKRTALFRLLPDVPATARERFEQDTLEMPAYIEAIRNWRLSRALVLDWDASGAAPWSYVWEQEYATLDGLSVDYMLHPQHWAHVDRAFDPESGVQLIDATLCHAFCASEAAFITR